VSGHHPETYFKNSDINKSTLFYYYYYYSLGTPRRRWEDNRMNLGEVGWSDVDWTDLAQDRSKWRAPVNLILNLLVP
jgi:hypothetical protein